MILDLLDLSTAFNTMVNSIRDWDLGGGTVLVYILFLMPFLVSIDQEQEVSPSALVLWGPLGSVLSLLLFNTYMKLLDESRDEILSAAYVIH